MGIHGKRVYKRQKLDDLGNLKSQICLPSNFRQQVLQMAHEGFGHQGKTKVAHHIQKAFYWPSDVTARCRSCEKCQRINKTTLRVAPMVEVEVLTGEFALM